MKFEGGAKCVILYKPENAIVSKELFDRCWKLFGHGVDMRFGKMGDGYKSGPDKGFLEQPRVKSH